MVLKKLLNYKDKVVIVTGGARGIGRAIAMAYAAEGASVIIGDIDSFSAGETLRLIEENGGAGYFIETDLSIPDHIVNLIFETEKRFSSIEILINNGGVYAPKSPYDLSVDEWDRIINTNLRSVFLCSREAAKVMRKNKKGSIVNIASTRAFMSEPATEAYAASKGGIVAITHALAASFASDNIQVNCISPGWIETGDYNSLSKRDHKQHLSGRVGFPEDIARACLYLTDENNNFVNGTNLIIDGGMTRKMIYE